MKTIPYINLQAQHAALKTKILEAISDVIEHSNFILGEEVKKFEDKLARYCQTRYAVGVNSGTDAIMLALKAFDIGPGDEVITAPNSFLASASSVIAVGARPVFVDIREDLNIDPTQIEEKITPQTRAILAVHLTGKAADMSPIHDIAKKHRLKVIEDAAQAIGTTYQGKKTGNLGDVGCFSFHPLKTLNACGDGGAITTNDEDLYTKFIQLRNIGLKNRNEAEIWGYNSRLDSIQAAILSLKCDFLEAWIEERRKNAAIYSEYLQDWVMLPKECVGERATYHTFVIQTDCRDELQKFLEKNGVETKIHYPIPIHFQKAAASFGLHKGKFPVCEKAADRILSLPIYQGLQEQEIFYIANKIKEFLKKERQNGRN